jgi:hypothetical protein
VSGKYDQYVVQKAIREAASGINVTGRTAPTYTFMSNQQVPGCNIYCEVSWIWDVPDPNPAFQSHKHGYNELVLNLGTDPHNPEDLGAEIESYMGGEKQATNKTTAIWVPQNVSHGPVIWRKVTRPHIQLTVVLGTGNFKEAVPGGIE